MKVIWGKVGSQRDVLGYYEVFVEEEGFGLVFQFSFRPFVEVERVFGTVFLFLVLVP